jgi:hypothetical protein
LIGHGEVVNLERDGQVVVQGCFFRAFAMVLKL